MACEIAFDGGCGLAVDADATFHAGYGFERFYAVDERFIVGAVFNNEFKEAIRNVGVGQGSGDDFVPNQDGD